MLDEVNLYAATCLCRQFIEVEYLVWGFATDPSLASKWLSATPDQIRLFFGPKEMRKRSAGRFREYWAHCDVGGHPNPKGAHLLPERVLDGDMPFGSAEYLWVDLGQHLQRLWASLVQVVSLDRVGSPVVARRLKAMDDLVREWHVRDPAAPRVRRHPG